MDIYVKLLIKLLRALFKKRLGHILNQVRKEMIQMIRLRNNNLLKKILKKKN